MTQTQELNTKQSRIYDSFHAILQAAVALHAILPEEPWIQKLDPVIVNVVKLAGELADAGSAIEQAPATTALIPETPQK